MVSEISKAQWETSKRKHKPGAEGFACPSFWLLPCPSFWLLRKIICGSLPFPHCGTALGPLCLPVGGRFYFDFICVLGFFYKSWVFPLAGCGHQ